MWEMTNKKSPAIRKDMGLFEEALQGIRMIAKKRGTPTRLSKELGQNPNTLSRWLAGTRRPTWEKLVEFLEPVSI